MPEIAGAAGGGGGGVVVAPGRTWMLKEGSVAVLQASLAAITMLEYVLTSAEDGAPESCPVLLSKLAHEGLWVIVNTRRRPSKSVAVGVKE